MIRRTSLRVIRPTTFVLLSGPSEFRMKMRWTPVETNNSTACASVVSGWHVTGRNCRKQVRYTLIKIADSCTRAYLFGDQLSNGDIKGMKILFGNTLQTIRGFAQQKTSKHKNKTKLQTKNKTKQNKTKQTKTKQNQQTKCQTSKQ